jgi:tetratricopeptide (TPR) repeat protein
MTVDDLLADVAAVYTGDEIRGSFGSGRLIAPGLILTAGHVVDYPEREAPTSGGWKVRLLREQAKDGAWASPPYDAQLLWRGADELDLALVQIGGQTKPTPSVKPTFASYDQLGTIDDTDAVGFPEAWSAGRGKLQDYRVRGALRLAARYGPYAWSVSPADKPDDPQQWRGMSGAAVSNVGPDGNLYLFGAVQQVPANFSGGLLEVARVSDAFDEADFVSHLQSAIGEKPVVVSWAGASFYGFARAGLTDLVEKLKSGEAILAEQEKLARRAAVSEKALAKIAQLLSVDNVPADELGPALIERIDRLQQIQRRAEALPMDSPIKPAVQAATDDGDYNRAEALYAVGLAQIHAVECINTGDYDRAIAALKDAERRLGDVTEQSPVGDRIVLGYIYKTFEQAYSAKGDKVQAQDYLSKAIAVFQALATETSPEGETAVRFAEAMNGLGNMRAAQDQHREAIVNYKIATTVLPRYAYAWHDMFLSYYRLAEQGEFHLAEMRRALAKTKKTGVGWPAFGPKYFAGLDSMMENVEEAWKRRSTNSG